MTTFLAFPSIAETLPIMLLATALVAEDALPLTKRFEMIFASIFVWKVTGEFNEVHRFQGFICKNTKNI